MNWNNGFSTRYYATVVDAQSWQDKEIFDITDGSISRTSDGLRESADVTCVNRRPSKEQWVRIYMEVRQGGSHERVALFTGLAVSPSREIDGSKETNPLECYSVLKASDDVLLKRGWYAPTGAVGAELVKSLLEQSTPAPVNVEGVSPKLQKYIIADDKETHLSMTDKVLDAIGWRMKIQGDGTILICPRATAVSGEFDSMENDSVKPQVSVTDDWYDCPNVFRATVGDTSAVARDDSPDSPLSTVNRGREVWAEETSCNLSDAESLGTYAMRRLKQLQRHAVNIKYSRRYNPDILVTDKVRLNYPNPKHDLVGVYTVTSQRISLGLGAETEEEVEAE